jgi:branched-chain amino acid transport system ATP-binding protein
MGLAPIVVDELYTHVAQLAEDGVTVVVVEQFARTALTVATAGVVMAGGRVVHAGPSSEIEQVLHSAYLGPVAPIGEGDVIASPPRPASGGR